MQIDVKYDIEAAERVLKELGAQTKYMTKNMLSYAIKRAQSTIKQSYGRYMKKRSGALYRSIAYKVKNGRAMVYSRLGYRIAAHENGAILRPRKFKYMTFYDPTTGRWTKTKFAKLERRPFFTGGATEYKKHLSADLAKSLEAEIEKFNKKVK